MLFAGRGIMRTQRGNSPRHQVDGVERDRRASGLRPPTHEANRQVQRSFEDTSLEQRALELVTAA